LYNEDNEHGQVEVARLPWKVTFNAPTNTWKWKTESNKWTPIKPGDDDDNYFEVHYWQKNEGCTEKLCPMHKTWEGKSNK
jgi:hypothetical protein